MGNESKDIIIDPEVLKERSTTYSSLTDINGSNVFSSSFQEKVKDYRELMNQAYEEMQGGVFIKDMNSNSNIYEQVKGDMFSNREIKMIKDAKASQTKGIGFAIPIIGITLIVVILIMIRYVEKRRRKWADHDADTYIYE